MSVGGGGVVRYCKVWWLCGYIHITHCPRSGRKILRNPLAGIMRNHRTGIGIVIPGEAGEAEAMHEGTRQNKADARHRETGHKHREYIVSL